MSRFVLVHGGWHGGWCWARLAARLRAAGHDVYTPTLTGLGEREHLCTPAVGLETHTVDILNLLHFERLSDVILVGHSYGGTIITLAADRVPGLVAALVYVDAVIPEDGVAGWDGFPKARQEAMLSGAAALDGLRVPPPDPSSWGIQSPQDLEWVRTCCTPHPIKTMHDLPRLGRSWLGVARKHYILAGAHANPRFVAHHAAMKKQPDWTTEVIDGGHDLMITHPLELSAALLRIGASISEA
ncbi:MAG: alpha/beta hydrolase [Burkholderiales bacterium]|nr:alpha/beta hydrolase [Burkholderiales bacterium]